MRYGRPSGVTLNSTMATPCQPTWSRIRRVMSRKFGSRSTLSLTTLTPPEGGVSVVSESVDLDPNLQDMTRRILDHVGWHGVAMVEFKVTPEGRAYLMEVNPRFWGSLQLAIDAGVDFPWLVYQLSSGQPPEGQRSDGALTGPMGRYRVGVRTRWLLGDLDHLYLRLRDERGLRDRWRAVCAFLRPLGPQTRHEVNRWDDWKPFVTELRQFLVGPGR